MLFTAAYVNYPESSGFSSSVSGAGGEQGGGGAAPVLRVGLAWPEPRGGVALAQTHHTSGGGAGLFSTCSIQGLTTNVV